MEIAVRIDVDGMVKLPETAPNKEFVGPCIKQREGNGYKAIAYKVIC